MFGRCALRLCECLRLARKRGVLSRRSTAGSGPLVARHRQVHASCEAETGNGHKRRSAKQAHQYGILGYKGARRKRLAQNGQISNGKSHTVLLIVGATRKLLRTDRRRRFSEVAKGIGSA